MDLDSRIVQRTLDFIWRSARITPRSSEPDSATRYFPGKILDDQNGHVNAYRKGSVGALSSRNGSVSSRGGDTPWRRGFAFDEAYDSQQMYDVHENDQDHDDEEKWVKIGFESENLRAEFARTGLLGLDCLVSLF